MSDPKSPESDDRIEATSETQGSEEESLQPWGAGARPPRQKRARMWAGLTIVVVIAATVLAWPVIEEILPPGTLAAFNGAPAGPDPTVIALVGRIDRLEAEESRLKRSASTALPAASPSGDSTVLVEIQAAASRLQSRLGALEAKLTSTAAPETTAEGSSDNRLQAVDKRLAALEAAGEKPNALAARLEALERKIATDTGAAARDRSEAALARVSAENERLAAALGRINQKVAGLGALLAEADKRAEARAGLGRDLQIVADRLDRLEDKAARLADANLTQKGDALLLAIGQLREAIAGDRPFNAELEAVLRIAGTDSFVGEATTSIAPLAARGIETQDQLVRRFPALAAKAAQAAIAPEEGDWIDRTVARLARVVTVRRVGENISGETTMVALARAEAKLAGGDLAGGEAALDPVVGRPAEVLAEWRAAALARTAAKAAIGRLSKETIERLSNATAGDTNDTANGAAQ